MKLYIVRTPQGYVALGHKAVKGGYYVADCADDAYKCSLSQAKLLADRVGLGHWGRVTIEAAS